MKNLNNTGRWLFLVIGFISCLFALTPHQLYLEQVSGLRQLFKSRGYLPPPKEIVIVAISNAVAAELNYPPQVVRWSRVAHAELLDALDKAGAALVVMDIAFKESRPEQDQILAEAMERAGNVVIFKYLKRNRTPSPLNDGGMLDIEQQVLPPTILLDKALGAASFTLPKVPGVVASAPIYEDLGNGDEPTQPLMAFLEYHREAVDTLVQAASLEGVLVNKPLGTKVFHQRALALRHALLSDHELVKRLENTLIRNISEPDLRESLAHVLRVLQRESSLYINFYGPNRSLNVIPMDAFFSAEPLPDLNNKIVFVGASETSQTEQFDVYQTVYRLADGVDISGVEISATVLANLLYENDLRTLSPVQRSIVAACFIILALVCFVYLRPVPALIVQVIVMVLYYQFALWLFSQHYQWLPLALPLIILFIMNIAALYLRFLNSRKHQQHVLNTLSHYLPGNVAKQLSSELIALEKQHRLVQGICLMTDLQGYTRVSESLPPQQVHQKLNRYYETLVDIVNQHGGSVANIVGDSLLAIWTGPVVDEALCRQAFNAACTIIEQNNQTDNEGIQLTTSIALHGGEFSLGNLGGSNHFEYSPVGDIVNTTSRIEQLNRDLGTKLLCSATISKLLPEFEHRYLGKFALKNKAASITLYEITGKDVDQNLPLLHQRNQMFKLALEKFEQSNWSAANQLFEQLLKQYPDDGPASYYINQCRLKSGPAVLTRR